MTTNNTRRLPGLIPLSLALLLSLCASTMAHAQAFTLDIPDTILNPKVVYSSMPRTYEIAAINVEGVNAGDEYSAIGFSGLMCGFGGAFMSMYYAAGWSLDMVAGRGFIALAAQAMGGGECLGGMLSSLVFGFAQALGIKFSAVGLDSNLASPIPYAVTIIGLVIFSLVRRSRAKKLHSAAALK